MSARAKEWAKKARAQMIAELGGQCMDCLETNPKRLQFDHVHAWTRTWECTGLSTDQRMCRYRADRAAGIELQLLCETCNARKSQTIDKITSPF